MRFKKGHDTFCKTKGMQNFLKKCLQQVLGIQMQENGLRVYFKERTLNWLNRFKHKSVSQQVNQYLASP